MIVLVSLIVLLRGFPCFHDFSHGASLHPFLNDFCTCSAYFSWLVPCASAIRTMLSIVMPLHLFMVVQCKQNATH